MRTIGLPRHHGEAWSVSQNHREFADGGRMADCPLLVNLLSGSGGAIIGAIGTLIAVKMQNQATDKRDRTAVATHFYRRAHGIGVQASREMPRAASLELPMEP